jgi:hypothetical protein
MIGNQPGLGPENLEGNPTSGSFIALISEVFQTPLIDITKPLSGMEIVPARPGYVPVCVLAINWSIESVVGVQTSPVVYNAGQDAAHTNVVPALSNGPSNAEINGVTPPSIRGVNAASVRAQLMTNTPVFLDITQGAQGVSSCLAKLNVGVLWVAIGGQSI